MTSELLVPWITSFPVVPARVPSRPRQSAQPYLYRLNQLKSSVRTKILNYTAFSRAIDGAENVEADFNEKRNANTFEIKRTRKRRH